MHAHTFNQLTSQPPTHPSSSQFSFHSKHFSLSCGDTSALLILKLCRISFQGFLRIYKSFFPHGDPAKFASLVFRVFDENKVSYQGYTPGNELPVCAADSTASLLLLLLFFIASLSLKIIFLFISKCFCRQLLPAFAISSLLIISPVHQSYSRIWNLWLPLPFEQICTFYRLNPLPLHFVRTKMFCELLFLLLLVYERKRLSFIFVHTSASSTVDVVVCGLDFYFRFFQVHFRFSKPKFKNNCLHSIFFFHLFHCVFALLTFVVCSIARPFVFLCLFACSSTFGSSIGETPVFSSHRIILIFALDKQGLLREMSQTQRNESLIPWIPLCASNHPPWLLLLYFVISMCVFALDTLGTEEDEKTKRRFTGQDQWSMTVQSYTCPPLLSGTIYKLSSFFPRWSLLYSVCLFVCLSVPSVGPSTCLFFVILSLLTLKFSGNQFWPIWDGEWSSTR